MKNKDLTQEYLKSVLDYNPDTGNFVWKYRELNHHTDKAWNKQWAGKNAGSLEKSWGDKFRFKIRIKNKDRRASHIAWIYHFGEHPEKNLDHINGNALDNRICNLRLASNSENGCNRSKNKNNTSGFKGVTFNKKSKKWVAQIGVNKKNIYLGLFLSAEEAYLSYCQASEIFHMGYGRVA